MYTRFVSVTVPITQMGTGLMIKDKLISAGPRNLTSGYQLLLPV